MDHFIFYSIHSYGKRSNKNHLKVNVLLCVAFSFCLRLIYHHQVEVQKIGSIPNRNKLWPIASLTMYVIDFFSIDTGYNSSATHFSITLVSVCLLRSEPRAKRTISHSGWCDGKINTNLLVIDRKIKRLLSYFTTNGWFSD